MKLPRYELQPEVHGDVTGYRICLNFHGQHLPIPNEWYGREEAAERRVAVLQRADIIMLQQESSR